MLLAIPLGFGAVTFLLARRLYTGVPQEGLAAGTVLTYLGCIPLIGGLKGLVDGAWTRSGLFFGALAGPVVCGTLVSRAGQVLRGDRPAPGRR